MAQNLFSPMRTQEGAALANLVSSLYSGDGGEAKRAEREAALENRRLDRQLKLAQIAEHERKRMAEEEAKRGEAEVLVNAIRGLTGGGDPTQIMDYRKAGGVVQPQAETSETPGIMGGYEMDRPAGYTPQVESLVNNLEATNAFARGLPGKTNAEQLMKGAGALQQQRSIADVIAGAIAPEKVAPAYAAAEGKPLYSDSQGRILGVHTGALNESGQQAQSNVAFTKSATTENLAQAGKANRDDGPLVAVRDPNSPTGFVYARRGTAVGQPAPLPGATKVTDALVPTAPNMTEGQRIVNDSADTKAMIAEARTLAQDPRNFGLSGGIRATVQDLMQQGDALAKTLGSRAAAVQQDVMALGSDVGLENFDTTIPQLDLMTNLLAFRLAKMNDPGGRVTDQDFRNAKAKITGGAILGNQADFLSRLDLFERTLSGIAGRRQEFMGGRGQSGSIQRPGNIAIPPPQGASPEPTATNPMTGERLVFRNGQWQPLR